MTIREILSEDLEVCSRRQSSRFRQLLDAAGGRVVLFGAGRLGKKVALELCRKGIKPLGFIDNDKSLHGSKVVGIPVFSAEEAAGWWSVSALFIVTTFLPDRGGVKARIAELRNLGCRRITTYLSIAWVSDTILPHFGAERPTHFLARSTELFAVWNLLYDKTSREALRQALLWRIREEFDTISEPTADQYFPSDLLVPNDGEIFIDGGAYVGDTLCAVPWKLAKAVAIEPDPTNAAKLRKSCGENVEIREVLLGRERGIAHFDAKGTMASSRSSTGGLTVEVSTIDEIAFKMNPTFIKLDVEGDELAALQGGINTIGRAQPIVAVCVYHRPDDLWEIPLFLNGLLPNHRMFLRAHAWDGFELVVYSVPRGRSLI
jgi:FkbM family methyltransferase